MNIYQDRSLIKSIKDLLTPIAEHTDFESIHPSVLYSHYYNFIFRLILSSPRVTHKSANFDSSYGDLSSDEKGQVDLLLAKITTGEDLREYQSKQVLTYSSKKLDNLLMDWGIFHLHLKPSRSGKLIFAVFNKDNAYLLDIKDHDSFADKDLLQILDDTWSELIEHRKVPEHIKSLHSGFEGSDLTEVRRNGVDTFQVINDRIIPPLGGGITSATTSGLAQDNLSKLFRLLEQYPNKSYKLTVDCIVKIEDIHDPSEKHYIYFFHPSVNIFGTPEYLSSIIYWTTN